VETPTSSIILQQEVLGGICEARYFHRQ